MGRNVAPMAKIKVLSENIVHKIAAGEVIERPASVVKELVENAIDAGARRLYIEATVGGRQSIRVVDDGEGMERDDVLLSVQRHATSKMTSPSDLFDISTLGFRGEALASIGAVSRLTIETCRTGQQEGTRLVVEGGIQREISSMGRGQGTTISVRNLFFNTPARRKFLRRVDTETRHITQVLVQLAACQPQVGFEWVHQGHSTLHVQATEPQVRAAEILGVEVDKLLPFSGADEGIEVEGWVSHPGACTRARTRQYVAVQGRPIVARFLNQAVYRGFGGLLTGDYHPAFVLWLRLDPRRVDVNVHPAKREVRFADERLVGDMVQQAVRQGLAMPETSNFTYSGPDSSGDSGQGQIGEAAPERSLANDSLVYRNAPSNAPELSKDKEAPGLESKQAQSRSWAPVSLPISETEPIDETAQMALSLLSPKRLQGRPLTGEEEGDGGVGEETLEQLKNNPQFWQIHDKYFIAPIENGIIIVDQHAAHERIRYEEALAAFTGDSPGMQQLLFPHTVQVNPLEKNALEEMGTSLEKLGFSVRPFGPGSIVVDAVPIPMKNWQEGQVLQELISVYLEEKNIRNTLQEAVAASYACHSSIRTGDKLSVDEMQALLERLLSSNEPFVCPHGRPIIVKIALSELDRMFGRT
ncbi:MAG: DNA mismatch repair endonuclease MutL [Candidatus Latescibacteria bacterium]|nr:DNA mismatch repair endonuclease MutL [Candidatus Latescibacterota bacterium]